jgi:exopolyphosphatase/guanosine-5'-triphosphate,3'-diphosphate pyrophosphatase
MKYASIDIGTNTVLMFIAEYSGGGLKEILDLATITRLGEGLKETGLISGKAAERTFAALRRYKETAEQLGADEIVCVGTAALREARNSADFVEQVNEELGIRVRVISGRDEAYYTYLSVKEDRFPGTDRFIIVDIGGGSTELIEGDRDRFLDFVSLPVGSVKLTEMFIRSDPPGEDEIVRLTRFLKETISAPFNGSGATIVGTAGTITNLAGIVLGLETYEKEKVHGLRISLRDIDAVIGRLKGLTVGERGKVRGMEQGREDILLQGILLMGEIMRYFGAEELVVSANGVRYGVLYEKLRCPGA